MSDNYIGSNKKIAPLFNNHKSIEEEVDLDRKATMVSNEK